MVGLKRTRSIPDEVTNEHQPKKQLTETTLKSDSSTISSKALLTLSNKTIHLLKLDDYTPKDVGSVLIFGTGDAGQLGLGEDMVERKKPYLLNQLKDVIQVVAGGMHTAALTKEGEIYTWGCNDDNALGRPSSGNDCPSEYEPGLVQVPATKIIKKYDATSNANIQSATDDKPVQISAGDSHTAVLMKSGIVYACGIFRDSSGKIGMKSKFSESTLTKVFDGVKEKAVKIASGNDHILILTELGRVYSYGCGEQGQLGCVSRYFTDRGGRRGLYFFYQPKLVYIRKFKKGLRKTSRPANIVDIFCGSYCSFAIDDQNTIYGWGLNNFGQLAHSSLELDLDTDHGIDEKDIILLVPTPLKYIGDKITELSLNDEKMSEIKSVNRSVNGAIKIAAGQHHSLFFDSTTNQVFSCGRSSYGRLGIGSDPKKQIYVEPCLVNNQSGLQSKIKNIACGETTSYFYTENGDLYSWGMGNCLQLGADDEEDIFEPYNVKSKNLTDYKVIDASAGGQHVVLLAQKKV